jgi:hypothetical protein
LYNRIRTIVPYFNVYGADIAYILKKSAPFSSFLKKMGRQEDWGLSHFFAGKGARIFCCFTVKKVLQ